MTRAIEQDIEHLKTLQHLFWRNITIAGDDDNECWNWGTPKFHGKTGKVNVYQRGSYTTLLIAAPRFSWLINMGTIPDGLHVLHKCDNPRCVNPDHLFLGTHQDNMDDKRKKGRAKNSLETREKMRQAAYRRYR